jgi:hypothetical protein
LSGRQYDRRPLALAARLYGLMTELHGERYKLEHVTVRNRLKSRELVPVPIMQRSVLVWCCECSISATTIAVRKSDAIPVLTYTGT